MEKWVERKGNGALPFSILHCPFFREFAIAPGGFEPPFSDPKSDVLPLDEGADERAG